jgi:hypothetical protein
MVSERQKQLHFTLVHVLKVYVQPLHHRSNRELYIIGATTKITQPKTLTYIQQEILLRSA